MQLYTKHMCRVGTLKLSDSVTATLPLRARCEKASKIRAGHHVLTYSHLNFVFAFPKMGAVFALAFTLMCICCGHKNRIYMNQRNATR